MPSGNLTDLVLASVVRPLVTDNDFDSFCMIVKDFSMHGTLTTQSDEKHRHSSRTNDFFFLIRQNITGIVQERTVFYQAKYNF